jgi:hypothetical protein
MAGEGAQVQACAPSVGQNATRMLSRIFCHSCGVISPISLFGANFSRSLNHSTSASAPWNSLHSAQA